MKRYLEVGKIVSLHGIAGEVKVYPWCDSPKVLAKIKKLWFDAEGKQPVDVVCRTQNTMALCKIKGIDTPEQARTLINKVLYADRGDISLEEGRYFIEDLVGLKVIDADKGEAVGEVEDVLPAAASDIYSIRMNSGEVRLVPAVKQFVKSVDIEKREIVITPIAGLLYD